MSTRKYPSGNDKRKKKKKQEQLTQALSGSLNKYFTSSQRESISVENLVCEEAVNVNPNDPMDIVDREEREGDNSNNIPPARDQGEYGEPLDVYDPNNWNLVDQNLVDMLVEKGPIRVEMEDSEYPRDDNKRHFSNVHYTRVLPNKEKVDRRWLVYSKSVDKLFCFCCKLFEDKKRDSQSQLITTGFRNWHNIGSRLKQHETSREHILCMHKLSDLETRLRRNQTIDKVVQQRIKVEKEHNREVFFRVMGAIKWLVKNNLAYRGFKENAYEEDDEMFLGLIEMIDKFDPVMQVYLERRNRKDIQYDYLSHEAQIELIRLLANEVKSAIVEKIKKAKYFSVILDEYHGEQASLLIRCVDGDDIPVKVVEYFLGYIKVDDTTGIGLFSELEKALSRVGLKIQDIRGQAYGNGVNIKGRRECVQSRLLSINPRAFYAPYDGHDMNLAFCDMANSSPRVCSFFGSVQRLYNLFSSSTIWWDILKRHVNDLTFEPSLSETRWESYIESIKTIKHNALKISDALVDLANSDGDSLTVCEADLLATREFESFEFLVSTMIWYEVLSAASTLSKTLQSEDMHLDVAIDQLNGLIARFREYKEHGFNDALIKAQELAREMDIEPVFDERKTFMQTKVQFDYECSSDERSSLSPQECFRIEFFVYIVNNALTSLNETLEQLRAYERNFGFLFDLKKKCTDDTSLKKSCENLSNVLSHNGQQVDLDSANELFMELKAVRQVLPSEIRTPIQVLNYLKEGHNGFPNMGIAYRILLTIPVTVPSGQRSCSKLELVKNYLRNTASGECLNELAMIYLENDMVEKIDCSSLFDKFASKRVRRPTFK